MGFLQRLFGNNEDINSSYAKVRNEIISKAAQQSNEMKIDIVNEPYRISEMVPLPGNVDGEHYWGVADFILAEYPTELALVVSTAFNGMAPQLGFGPYGKIMIGAQFVDRKAGNPSITSISFIKEHPLFYEFVTERECPERTKKALDLLVAAVFQFQDADDARKVFPKAMVVPEMKKGVKDKLYSIDESVARYIVG